MYKRYWMLYTLILCISLSLVNEFINTFWFNMPTRFFIVLPLMLLLFIGGIVIFGLSVAQLFKTHQKTIFKKDILTLCLSIILLLSLIYRPFSPLFQKAEFAFKFDKREKIAFLILNDEIQPSNDLETLFSIPDTYKHSSLSDGNEVMKINEKLFFFTVRGILDNFSGYIFSPDGTPPTEEDVQADIVEIRKMNHHWYYVACT